MTKHVLLMAGILIVIVLVIVRFQNANEGLFFAEDPGANLMEFYWPESDLPVIRHSTFTLAYDEAHEQAGWVAYILTRDELNRKFVDRTDWFENDAAVPTGSADFYDYKGSGYTKGHLVPSADRAWNRKVNEETFLMSNISPQTYHFNGGIWRELEENVRDWARANDRLYIVTGPVIGQSSERIGSNQVTVPEAFFKVLLDLDLPDQKAIAFLIPNEKSDRPLEDYALTVSELEQATGINFYDRLIPDDELENQLESTMDMDKWPVDPDRFRVRIEHWNK